MSGYVNLVIRKGGVTRRTTSYTGSIAAMFNASFFMGEERAINRVFNMYRGCTEVQDEAKALLAPFNYGLVVVDFDQKVAYSMQKYSPIYMAGVAHFSYQVDQIPELLRCGWLGEGLVDSKTGELLPEAKFPPDLEAKDVNGVIAWIYRVTDEIHKQRHLPVGTILPAVRLSPPGWVFNDYENTAGFRMLQDLRAAGFAVTKKEFHHWEVFNIEWARIYAEHSQEGKSL
jgi:hypothetical protein